MAKIVLICFRNCKQPAFYAKDIQVLAKRLTPDNISPPQPLIIDRDGLLIGVFNPIQSLPIKNTSVCIGNLIEAEKNWWQPMAKPPDGSYALFRTDETKVELITDIVASRTVWYIQTDSIFIASTSQRAIIFFLKNFIPNDAAHLWMLSSGSLGAGNSWDRRIKCLAGNSSVLLHRPSWTLKVENKTTSFIPQGITDKEHEARLKNSITHVLNHIGLDYENWALALSGGYDSRMILLALKNQKHLKCITWGTKLSLNNKYSDSHVANRLARYFNIDHRFFATDIATEPIEKIFYRFLIAGEGRIDHISAFMDGFAMWKLLFEEKLSGIIKGDEGFGWFPVITALDVRRWIESNMVSDFPNVKETYFARYKKQTWPEQLVRKQDETLSAWRDRLYHEYRIPYIIAGINDLLSSYVEVANPFLTRKIIEQVRKLPDHLRTNKTLFKRISRTISPPIPFARFSALEETTDILQSSEAVNIIRNELKTSHAEKVLSHNLIKWILKKTQTAKKSSHKKSLPLKLIIKRRIPKSLQNILRNTITKKRINFNQLAFRAYIICKMDKILSGDATSLEKKWARSQS